MDLQRSIFIFGFFFISFLVWEIWKSSTHFYSNQLSSQHHNVNLINRYDKNNILIKTDVLLLKVNLRGGDIEQAQLLNFKDKLDSFKPLILLDTKSNFIYQTRSGLIRQNSLDNWDPETRHVYVVKKKYFELKKYQEELHVPLTWTSSEGITYVKTFIFKPNSYDIEIRYKIYNGTDKELEISMFGGLRQTIAIPDNKSINNDNFSLQTFRGIAYSTDNNKYEKYQFDSVLQQKNLNIVTHRGWIAMLQQYFVTAWIPNHTQLNTFYTNKINEDVVEVGFHSNKMHIKPYDQIICNSKLWIGPEIQEKMAMLAPNLDLTVDYGWLWFLSQPLFKLLKILYNLVGNWGLSIILITFIIRGLTYPLTKSQYKTMFKMKKLKPKIDRIKQNYKHNRKKMSEEMLALYQHEKVNPLGGCLPLLVQMPIFLALYYMLISSVELRHAPFILWIKDLSDQDPYYVLPVLMGITMFFVQRITPNDISDPIQKNIMHIVPMIFTIFFLWFPSGLVLYYVVSNLVTIIQQKFISDYFKDINKLV
ncbi:MAG: membrane protein insertase YidC [Buchnera aphidicola (Meitanaphis elongallis)]